jgi:hypothetical protein
MANWNITKEEVVKLYEAGEIVKTQMLSIIMQIEGKNTTTTINDKRCNGLYINGSEIRVPGLQEEIIEVLEKSPYKNYKEIAELLKNNGWDTDHYKSYKSYKAAIRGTLSYMHYNGILKREKNGRAYVYSLRQQTK